MNVVVLEYEEKSQRGVAQVSQMKDQLASQIAHSEANINAYRRVSFRDTLLKFSIASGFYIT